MLHHRATLSSKERHGKRLSDHQAFYDEDDHRWVDV